MNPLSDFIEQATIYVIDLNQSGEIGYTVSKLSTPPFLVLRLRSSEDLLMMIIITGYNNISCNFTPAPCINVVCWIQGIVAGRVKLVIPKSVNGIFLNLLSLLKLYAVASPVIYRCKIHGKQNNSGFIEVFI